MERDGRTGPRGGMRRDPVQSERVFFWRRNPGPRSRTRPLESIAPAKKRTSAPSLAVTARPTSRDVSPLNPAKLRSSSQTTRVVADLASERRRRGKKATTAPPEPPHQRTACYLCGTACATVSFASKRNARGFIGAAMREERRRIKCVARAGLGVAVPARSKTLRRPR